MTTAKAGVEVAEEQRKKSGFLGTIAKRALAPLVATATTALTGYVLRKATEIWEEKVRPMVQEKGGGRAVARETLESAAEKVRGPASEKISALAEKVGGDGEESSKPAPASSESDVSREQERRQREQRRQQRRRAIERTGSS